MDATSRPGAKKRKRWPWARATGSAGRNEQRRQEVGKLWRKMIKESMGKRRGGDRQRRERKRLNPDHRMARWCLLCRWGCRTLWESGNLGSGPGSASSLLCDLG